MTLRHRAIVSHRIIDSPLTHWLTYSATLSEPWSAPLQVFIPLFHLPFVYLFTFSPNHPLSRPAILPNFCLLPAPTDMLSTLVWSILITKCSLKNTNATRTRRTQTRNTKVTTLSFSEEHSPGRLPTSSQITNSREQNNFWIYNFSSVSQIPSFCKIGRFITAFTTAHTCHFRETGPVYTLPTDFLKVQFFIFLPSMPRSSEWYFYLRFPHRNPVGVSPPKFVMWFNRITS
jgi:hypothetical protein